MQRLSRYLPYAIVGAVGRGRPRDWGAINPARLAGARQLWGSPAGGSLARPSCAEAPCVENGLQFLGNQETQLVLPPRICNSCPSAIELPLYIVRGVALPNRLTSVALRRKTCGRKPVEVTDAETECSTEPPAPRLPGCFRRL